MQSNQNDGKTIMQPSSPFNVKNDAPRFPQTPLMQANARNASNQNPYMQMSKTSMTRDSTLDS